MPAEIDLDRLTAAIVDELRRHAGEWFTFAQLARRVRGDASDADLIAAIVDSRQDLFIVHGDRRVKIRLEAQLGKTIPPSQQSPQLSAAWAVREYARQLRPLRLPVLKVGPGTRVLERFLHSIEVGISDDSIRLADDTPVELVSLGGLRNPGHIAGVSRNEAVIYAVFRNEVMSDDLPAELVVSRTKPLLDIAERLEQLADLPTLAQQLMSQSGGCALSEQDSQSLSTKLFSLPPPWARVLWGPPGSGKTYCAATLAVMLVGSKPDERALVVAPSNVAVDMATLEIVSSLRRLSLGQLFDARRVVRFGYPRDDRVLALPELFGPSGLETLASEIALAQAELRRLSRRRATEAEVFEAKARLRQLQEQLKQLLSAHLISARIVATTITSAFMRTGAVIGAGTWHTVIIDEASMINGATFLALASIPARRFLLVGDPRQLGPIFEWERQDTPPSDVRHWVARDPYELIQLSIGSGLQKAVRTDDARMARVLSQRRCHPSIWQLVANLYPAVSTNLPHEALEDLASAPPCPGASSVLVDLSGGAVPQDSPTEDQAFDVLSSRYACACRKVGKTWENPPTAMRAIDVARGIANAKPQARIAIITPYRGQVRLLRRLLEFERTADERLKQVDVGTVHSYQGGEADVVVFDLVDGPPRMRLGVLLRDDSGVRLVNVAITRARGKLVFIAHCDWLRRQDSNSAGLLWKVLLGGAGPSRHMRIGQQWPSFPRSDAQKVTGGSPESPIEEIFLAELSRRKERLPHFVLQYRISDEAGRIVSRADIAFVEQRLAVYCDGARYHLQKEQWERDLRQRRELVRLGWQILAFSGTEIVADVQRCVDEVARNFG